MVPDFHIFLDLDDLQRIADLELYISRSHQVLVFVSAGYAQSLNAMRELRYSVEQGKAIIALLEPEAKRGGLTPEQMREQLTLNEPELGKAFAAALFSSEPVEWNRIGCFQDVTLRLIAERMLPDGVSTFVQGDITRVAIRLPTLANPPRGAASPQHTGQAAGGVSFMNWSPINSPLGGGNMPSPSASGQVHLPRWSTVQFMDSLPPITYHLCCSKYNEDAAELVSELERSQLHVNSHLYWTDQADAVNNCNAMLVYLTSRTWSNETTRELLANEVLHAIRLGVQLVLAHEVPGVQQAGRHPIEFAMLFETGLTPPALVAAGIYSTIAVPLKGGAWRQTSMALLMRAISEAESIVPETDARDGRRQRLFRRMATAGRMMRRSSVRQRRSVDVERNSVEEGHELPVLEVTAPRVSSGRSNCRSAAGGAPSHASVAPDTGSRRPSAQPAWTRELHAGSSLKGVCGPVRGRSASEVRSVHRESRGRSRGQSISDYFSRTSGHEHSTGLRAALADERRILDPDAL